MDIKGPDAVTILTNLGLTYNQARVYFALMNLGTASAKKIAKMSKITRQDIYRVLPYLEEKGLVVKEISRPAIYQAIPIQETFQILINQRQQETLNLTKKMGVIVEKIQTSQDYNKPKQKEFETIFVPEKRALLNRIQKSIENMQKSLSCITKTHNLMKHMFHIMDTALFNQKTDKKFEIRIISEKCENITLQEMNKKPNFEHRYISEAPKAHLLIIDDKEVFIRTSIIGDVAEKPSIWSNNPCLLAISINYFDTLWEKSITENKNQTEVIQIG